MQESQFANWLRNNGYDEGTVKSRVANCLRICEYEGDLDVHYNNDKCEKLIERLQYTAADEKENIPARHNVIINGNVRNGTATLKSAANLYISFKEKNEHKVNIAANIDKSVETLQANEKNKIDAYDNFLKHFNISKQSFYDFGIRNTMFSDVSFAKEQWDNLKKLLINNGQIAIRSYGRQGVNTQLFLDLYKAIFNNDNIYQDRTNNSVPRRNIQVATGYKTNINIFNYQCSHIFGKTKNPLMFEAVWNICLTPKMFDPLTGHETKGNWPKEYQKIFRNYVFEYYKIFIDDYNSFIDQYEVIKRIELYVNSIYVKHDNKVIANFKRDALQEWAKIQQT